MRIFYTIDKEDIPSIQYKMSLGGPNSMGKVDGLRLIFIDFYVPAPTPLIVRVRVRVTLRLTAGQSVCLGVKPRLGLMTRYLF
jgi:hypothetical protein